MALAGGLGVAGCHAPPLQGVGRATENPGAKGSLAITPSTAAPSAVAPDFLTRFARLGPDSFVSWGHAAGRYVATVYATPSAKELALRSGATLAAGTELVMISAERTTKKPGPTFFMRKEDAGWRFGILESEGRAEELTPCARCHAEAPRDHVFALP